MEISVIDIAQSSDDLESVNITLGTKRAKVVEGIHNLSTAYEERKEAKITSFFNDRIILEATGANRTETQLGQAMKTIAIKSIIK